jgi:mono/diheme cytochrome c family protein
MMRSRTRSEIGVALALVASATVAASSSLAQAPPAGGAAGQTNVPGGPLYQKLCSQCHGVNGDGQGIATPRVLPRPRDFTAGKFKVRTTPSGALPTDDDLRRVIRQGMPYSSMPGWSHLDDAQIDQLVTAVKSFSPDFADAARKPTAIEVPDAPKFSAESAEKGKTVFAEIGCASCHGEQGRGDGTSAPGLKDDWGHPIRPADLTKRWTFRGGPTRADIYRTFTTGMNGTPMPSFAESLSDEQRWQLVDYIASLDPRDEPGYAELLQVKWSDEELDLTKGRELFATAPPAYFSVVGQVTEPGRAFHPSANGVTVRAVYNAREIAFLVTWHDMRADQRGANAPDLQVPPEEDQGEAPAGDGAAAPAAGEGDFWGEEEAAPRPASDTAPAAEEGDFWGEEGGAAAAAEAPAGEAFSDAVAIQLPVSLPTGIRKPYFLFGDAENPVDLWFVDLAQAAGGVARRYVGAGSASLTPVEGEDVAVAASYDKGEWAVILKRSLKGSGGVTFVEAQYVPVAFTLWDGAVRERGNKRGLTQWKYLYTLPKSTPSPVWPMLRSALAVLAIEVGLIAWVRRKQSLQPGEAEAHV